MDTSRELRPSSQLRNFATQPIGVEDAARSLLRSIKTMRRWGALTDAQILEAVTGRLEYLADLRANEELFLFRLREVQQ